MGSILTSRFSADLNRALPEQITRNVPLKRLSAVQNPQILLSPEAMARVKQGFAALGPDGQALLDQVMAAMQGALATSIQEVFVLGLGLILSALAASLFLKEIPLQRTHH